MRGSDIRSGELFSYVDLEKRVPGKHPLRLVRMIATSAVGVLYDPVGTAADGAAP
jgi:hypothetical protein